jgi:hypothetical protein
MTDEWPETIEGKILLEDVVRSLVREEIASLAGLAMRRLQDERFTRSLVHNEGVDAAKEVMGHFWAEVLAEYGAAGLVAGELDDPDVAEASPK